MGSSKIKLSTSTFFKGNCSCSREFSIFQDNKNTYTFCLIFSCIVAFLLNYLLSFAGSKWKSSYYVTTSLVFSVLVIFCMCFTVKKETLLLVVPVAMQLTTTYVSGRETVTYIPWYLIGNLMILDVIVGQQVLYFLAVDVGNKNSECSSHTILFRHTRPRLKYLNRIYKELQEVLDSNS